MFPDSWQLNRGYGIPHRQRGMGLPGAIFIIVVLALVVAALTNIEQRSGESLGQDVQSTHAFLAAETGAQAGMSVLFPPGGAASDCGNSYFGTTHTIGTGVPGLGRCTFNVSCSVQTDNETPASRYFRLTSIGVCGSGIDRAQRAVQVGARNNP